jgi:L-lactate dehydrogenase complex protein LldG
MNLTNAMAEVHRTTRDGLAAALVALVRDKQLSSVALGPELMDQATICHPLGAVTQIIPVTTPDAERDALFESVSAGLTLSRAAIAETGTIALWMSAQSPRLLSLVPPIHIVIVEGHTVHDTLFDLMQQASWADGLPTNVILVSSPSKTADIQQTLAYGAHGPKQLIVILVEDTP